MNILEIVVIVLFAVLAILGFRAGFIKKLASVLSLVLSLVLVSVFLPYLTDFLKNDTPIYTGITKQCRQAIEKQITENLPEGAQSIVDGTFTPTKIEQIELIEELPLPEVLKDRLLDFNNEEGYRTLGVTSFLDYLSNSVANVILNAVSFLAAVIVVRLLLRLLLAALHILSHIPVLRGIDHLAGLALGILEALFLLWLFYLMLSICSGTEPGLILLSMVQESSMLSYLYNANLFLQIVLRSAMLLA